MKHHLLIAGTGRSGTSVLVKYLAELGLNTNIEIAKEQTYWDETANAGLEDLILHGGDTLPYVVKSPWLYEFVDEVLDRDEFQIDGVIIPIRNLAEAASSRAIVEIQNIHKTNEWMAEDRKTWDTWATTPGGVIYSLNPIDQARLLAVGFHNLVERLTNAGIPIYLLAFPRFAEDPEYLYSSLKALLPPTVDLNTAIAAHKAVINKSEVRVSLEISNKDRSTNYQISPENYPKLTELDNVALRREIAKLRRTILDVTEQLRVEREVKNTSVQTITSLRDEIASLQDDKSRGDKIARELQRELDAVLDTVRSLRDRLDSIQSSTTWRITAPIRRVLLAAKIVDR